MGDGWSVEDIARQIADDLPPGTMVNLGIGMPTTVAAYLSPDRGVIVQSENGIIGMGPPPTATEADPDVIDAGKMPATLLPGASIVDHATSFALIRGGRLDYAVLGAFQVAENGDLANWRTEADELGSVGGAMDIAIGARKVFVMMRHQDRDGASKLVRSCTYPLTAHACVTRVYTDLATIDVTPEGFVVRRIAPGVTHAILCAATSATVRFESTAAQILPAPGTKP